MIKNHNILEYYDSKHTLCIYIYQHILIFYFMILYILSLQNQKRGRGKQKAARPTRRHALSERQLAYFFDGILGSTAEPMEPMEPMELGEVGDGWLMLGDGE